MVRITNTPNIFEWMQPLERLHIEKCVNLLPSLLKQSQTIISNFWKIGYFNVSHEASFVAHVSNGKSYVLKSDPLPSHSKLEALILKKWAQIGISVPNILEVGEYDGIEYFIMEKVKAPILSSPYKPFELIETGYIKELGRILNKMHQIKGTGFGEISDESLQGSHRSPKEYLFTNLVTDETKSLIESGEITIAQVKKLEKAIIIIDQFQVSSNEKPSLCHMDFYPGNVFKTEPLTIFDPNEAVVLPPIIDLGSAIIKTLYISFKYHNDLKSELLKGYSENFNLQIDEKVLNAAIYTQGFRQLRSWNRKGKKWRVNYIKDYLEHINF